MSHKTVVNCQHTHTGIMEGYQRNAVFVSWYVTFCHSKEANFVSEAAEKIWKVREILHSSDNETAVAVVETFLSD